MKLVIAEKPSVAQSLAKVIGANKRQDGYLEGGEYLVSWCVGHLVELSAPECYDERFSKWRLEDLPTGLKNRRYDIIILHSLPEDKALYCQRYMDEQICLTVDENHSFAKRKSISFAEMRGMRILVSGRIGFWMDICKKHLSESDLLIQTSSEALGELIEASTLPFFNSDRMIEMGYQTPGRVSIPINDEDAHATYWATCRTSDQNKYRAIFNAVRSYTLRHKTRNSR